VKVLFLILLLLRGSEGYSQSETEQVLPEIQKNQFHEIELSIRSKGTGRYLKRAEIKIDKEIYYTNPVGKVVVNIPLGKKGQILVQRFAYDKEFVDYANLREFSRADIFLMPATPGDNEVYIRGKKRPAVSRKSFAGTEASRATASGDPAQVTKTLPGVQTSAFGNEVAIRGSGPNDSQYFIDNFAVFDVFHAIGGISVLPDQLIDGVDFYAGGFGPQYGNATGGVIVLKTKSEIPEVPKTEFRINLPFYSAFYHERPLDDSSFVATSFRYSYLQYILPLFIPEGSGATIVPYFGDVHTLYHKNYDSGGYTKILALGSQDGLEAVFNYEDAASEEGKGAVSFYSGFATLGVEHYKPLGSGWSFTSSPQVYYNKADNEIFGDKLKWDFVIARINSEFKKKISKKEFLYLGIEPGYGIFSTDIVIPAPTDDPFFDFEEAPRKVSKRRRDSGFVNAWAAVDKQLGSLILTPGIRYYHDASLKNTNVLDPRLSSRFEFNEDQSLKAAVGIYSKAPEAYEADGIFGNPDLNYETSIHYILGLESRWGPKWETDVQLYYKKIFDKVVYDNTTAYSNDGSARSRGAELFIRRNLTDRAFGWLSYTYSQTEERQNDNQSWRSADYDQSHVATFTGAYRLTATWDFGSQIKYQTGDTYTPVNDSVYNATLDKYQPRPGVNDTNSKRLPDYHQIDLYFTKDSLYNTWKMSYRFGVQYLAVTKQVYSRNYNYDYSKEEDFNSLPPIPFVEVRGVL